MTRMTPKTKLLFTLLTCAFLTCPAAAYAAGGNEPPPAEPNLNACYERGCSTDELNAFLDAAVLFCAGVENPDDYILCTGDDDGEPEPEAVPPPAELLVNRAAKADKEETK